ncbi:transketolase [Pacificimonas flava]|uniref:Transketolase n=2 Tax=Pacificimonas TaxID=1960290 RepID=A0A219B7A5_9SPHN|nr:MULTISPECIES: transketolase [Pacificimonas]MBZ6378749.1 transketolase [Pacificimonas aurantium]OWV33986.1 transketolase [Pacificimonas flava]
MSVSHDDLANAIRALTMDAVEAANSGHPGMPMGMADAATVLFQKHLKFDAADPHWYDRDRFVLSAGHGSMLIYSLLYLTGYERPTIGDIRNFRQLDGPCAGHPENFLLDGVEATTGPLGQGLAMSVGMAMAERHLNAVYGDALVDHRTWVIAGDGCLMEGVNHEAVGLAGHLKLGRLNVIWDDNRITIDGPTDLSTSEDIQARYAAAGWHVVECNGHDPAALDAAMKAAKADPRPSLIAARTVIGYGAPNKQGTSATHGAPLGGDEIEAARETLGWTAPPFEIPDAILSAWREIGCGCADRRASWLDKAKKQPQWDEFAQRMDGGLPDGFETAIEQHIDSLIAEPVKEATRKSSENVLKVLNGAVPSTMGGSADLTGSNNTRAGDIGVFSAEDYSGRYVFYGIREFGMAAAMNGMALHGGVIPYGGTFLIFSDYSRPAIRLGALQQVRAVHVLTHDSIGLGEDGPTHQPIEQVMSLRAIPNLRVFRPADAVETAECWALALKDKETPAALALTRQGLPQVRLEGRVGNLSAKGAYRLKAADAARKVIFIATGSEVHLALEAADRLEKDGVGCDVVSMPCWELFAEQPDSYKEELLPNVQPGEILRVSIEAGTTQGWAEHVMLNGLSIGIDRFGASAPAPALFEKFGFTPDQVVARVKAKLES